MSLTKEHVEGAPALEPDPALEPPPSPAPDRALLGYVRGLAKEAAEPGWALHDYAALDQVALEAEAARLEALLSPAAAQPQPALACEPAPVPAKLRREL